MGPHEYDKNSSKLITNKSVNFIFKKNWIKGLVGLRWEFRQEHTIFSSETTFQLKS